MGWRYSSLFQGLLGINRQHPKIVIFLPTRVLGSCQTVNVFVYTLGPVSRCSLEMVGGDGMGLGMEGGDGEPIWLHGVIQRGLLQVRNVLYATNRQPLSTATNHQAPSTHRSQPPPTATNRQSPTANRQSPPTAKCQSLPTMVENMSYTLSFCKTAIHEHFLFLLRTGRTVRLWDAATRVPLQTLEGHSNKVLCGAGFRQRTQDCAPHVACSLIGR